MANQTKTVSLYDPSDLYDSRPSFSHVSSIETPVRLVYTAGQTGEDKDGKVAPGGFTGQARLALQNVKTCLAAAGASVRDITKLTFYVVNWAENKNYFGLPLMEFLTDSQGIYRPPSTLISVAGLVKPDLLVEIEAVAAVPISKETSVDVIVVGAGLSGLQAVKDIQESGLSCIVLEARDRVGGKTLSIELDSGNGVLDVGAAWLNQTTQPRIYALAKKYGLETVDQRTSGDEIMQNSAGDFERVNLKSGKIPTIMPIDDLITIQKIQSLLETEAAKIDINNPGTTPCENITAAEFFTKNGASGDSFETLSTTVKALLGVDADELSLPFYLDYIRSGGTLEELQSDESDGAQYQRLRQGMQTISKRMAADLKLGSVHLNSPVSNIHQTANGCVIKTSNGSIYHAKKVIITIPTPLYKTITFSPPLPTNKATLSDSTTLGYYAKTILVYANPWWRDAGLRGSFSSLAGPVSFSRDTCVPEDKQYSITCFIVGNTGRKWSILSPLDRQQAVLEQIAKLSGPDLATKVYNTVQIIEQEWIKEPWSQGAPSPVMKPGLEEFGASLREPFQNLHFAGTETAFEWKGYMDGAIRAGERAAKEIIEIL